MRAKRTTVHERLMASKTLMMGLPNEMSIEGAELMERVIAILYTYRVMTLGQISRFFPDEKSERLAYLLKHYPYILKQTMRIHRYDPGQNKWFDVSKVTVYSLPLITVSAYEEDNKPNDEYTFNGEFLVEHKPRGIENTLNAVDWFLTIQNAARNKKEVEWHSNRAVSLALKEAEIISEEERLTTTGFVTTSYRGNDESWGVGIYIQVPQNAVGITKKIFIPALFGNIEGIMLISDENLGTVIKRNYEIDQPKGIRTDQLYYRYVNYEFTMRNPESVLSLLNGNRHGVLDSLLEYAKVNGGKVEKTKGHAYLYRNVRYDGTVEYIDTTFGATMEKLIALIQYEPNVPAEYVLYVTSESEQKSIMEIIYGPKWKKMKPEELRPIKVQRINWLK